MLPEQPKLSFSLCLCSWCEDVKAWHCQCHICNQKPTFRCCYPEQHTTSVLSWFRVKTPQFTESCPAVYTVRFLSVNLSKSQTCKGPLVSVFTAASRLVLYMLVLFYQLQSYLISNIHAEISVHTNPWTRSKVYLRLCHLLL